MSEGIQQGIEGAKRAADHADRETAQWSDMAIGWVRILAMRRAEMTSETVRDYAFQHGLPDPPDPRAWGFVMPAAARAGHIAKKTTPEGYDVFVTGRNQQSHGRPVRVWSSLIFKPVV